MSTGNLKTGSQFHAGAASSAQADRAVDPVWQTIRNEVEAAAASEPMLASFLHAAVLRHRRFEDALGFLLADKLDCTALPAMLLQELIAEACASSSAIAESARADIRAVCDRDPAADSFSEPFLYFKGFHGLQMHRVAHWLWGNRREALALFVQSRTSEVFDVDIHPAARIGKGILVDHATSLVIGETAVVEDNVSLLHEVTLGGTGKDTGDRHPKVRRGVLIGAGAKILGNVEIGQCAKVGAGSVVLEDVPARVTVAGVPATVRGETDCMEPAREMDHSLPAGCGE